MLKIKSYVKAESLQQAYELNQKKTAVILGGMVWLKMGNRRVSTAIDLSGLDLCGIQEDPEEFVIGCMTPLHDLEGASRPSSLYRGSHKGMSSSYCRGAVPQLCYCWGKHLGKIWFFRCAYPVPGYGYLGGIV